MHCFCDFETRSLYDVGDVGAWKYAWHPSTYPLMLAYTAGDSVHQWLEYEHGKDVPASLADLIADDSVEFHAHNAGFEIIIYSEICHRRWGWPAIPLERWRDTAAKAAHANQPRSLGNLCERIGANERKDATGKELLKRLCVPQKAVKTKRYTKNKGGGIRRDSISFLEEHGIELFELPGKPGMYFWENDRALLDKLAKYNRQDVIAERDVDRLLPDLPPREQKLWKIDFEINARGIPIDRKLCEGVQKVFEVEKRLCNEAIADIAHEDDGRPDKLQVTASTQAKRIKFWINERVNFGESLDQNIVADWLKKPWGVADHEQAERVKQILELRQIAGGTAVNKYWAALDFMDDDDRCRGQLLYYGASTGRWTGKGIQPHNMIRLPIPDEIFFEAVTRGRHAEVKELAELFGYNVNGLLARCVRGMARAPAGKKLVVSDFAGIESRVLQWLAGNEKALQLFRDGADMYVHTASDIFEIPYNEMMYWSNEEQKQICKPQYKDKRQVGKICVLALGYGMGAGRYQGTCEQFGVSIDAEFAQTVVTKWREANPLVVDLWYRTERACKAVIRNRKIRADIDGRLQIYWDRRGYLCIRLPSGRVLYYFRAQIDKTSEQIKYLDGKKGWQTTYGGKLIENIVQAISRDLLVNSLFIAVEQGLYIIFHVHDELVAETGLNDSAAYGKLHAAMQTVPKWAKGLPLEAASYQQERYTK